MNQKLIKTTCGHEFVVLENTGKTFKPHSTQRPAVIYPDGLEEYYLYGIKYDKNTWTQLVKNNKKNNSDEI
jgi:hypothetical protein